ncbi:hypothetical protein ACHAP5_012078 [Fusarium lateritium]
MAPPHSILLQNATLLVPESHGSDRIVPVKNHSLLIERNKIVRIAAKIDPPSALTEVIDCTSKLVSPGFIDTHHHVWQTQMKGRHSDHTLLEYMPPDNAALSGTISSGIRSIYCYCPTARVKTWKPFELEDTLFPNWLFEQLSDLCKAGAFGGGRVTMGFAFDFYSLPKEVVVDIFERVRSLGIKTITSHYAPSIQNDPIVDLLESYGLLDKDILLSHVNPLSDSDAQKITKAGAAVSSTPETELQIGLGWPVCFQDNAKSISSLGIDCHSNSSGGIVGQMRVALQAERGRRNDHIHNMGKFPAKIQLSSQEVFQLGTIRGAKAINMEDQLGSLEEGKIADLLIWDMLSPGMICAAEENPIGAIILHSSPSDIDAVIVDGHFKKRDGRLTTTKLDLELLPELKLDKSEIEWRDVALELLKSRDRIHAAESASGADDRKAAFENGLGLLGIDKNKLVF